MILRYDDLAPGGVLSERFEVRTPIYEPGDSYRYVVGVRDSGWPVLHSNAFTVEE